MRKSRYLAPWQLDPADLEVRAEDAEEVARALEVLRGTPALYHCVSRIVNRELLIQQEEKGQFVELMRLYEKFCQVRVLTHCVMSNHVHLLVEVPEPPEDERASWPDEKLLDHLSPLYPEETMADLRLELKNHRANKNAQGAEGLRQSYLERMWDLSFFMKVIKQRFTQWFNPRRRRRGTLWEDRFKTVLVEPGHAAQVMAAYIDLNPVRAGLVEDPKDFSWSGYGEAVAGKKAARAGLQRLMSDMTGEASKTVPWREVVRGYRGVLTLDDDPAEDGEWTEGTLLRHRSRYFSDGLVFGSEEFVNHVFMLTRARFGPNRKTGARKMRGVRTNLRTMRDLQVDRYST